MTCQRPARRHITVMLSVVASLSLTQALLPNSTATADPAAPVVVASGLDNPRGLVLGEHGLLYVGEAGHAGPTCTAAPGENGPTCIGFTARISAVRTSNGQRRTVTGGLPSIGTAVAATGIDGVAFDDNRVAGIMTGSPQGIPADACTGRPEPACSQAVARASRRLGDLLVVEDGHQATSVAEVGRFDYQWIVDHKATVAPTNPDFQPGDSNPYGITAGPHDGWYVVDAGSNTLDYVDKHGKIKVLAYLPDPPGPPEQRFPYDAVPTCVATSGKTVWIGTLSGQVYRWDGHAATLVAGRDQGLTTISGCGTDRAGNLYVSNLFGLTQDTFFAPHTGSVSKVTPAGVVTTVAGSEGLSYPAGIAVSGHKLYVAVQSICPKDLALVGPQDPPVCDKPGQVVRLTL
ncbi:MAG: hypothetical protein JWM02_72 [Frankiales bacterium]|nr:hypothetical protein [Frankiales bacterium]